LILRPTSIAGAFSVHIEPVHDERGFFARTWCRREFAEAGIGVEIVQCSLSQTQRAGTVRGMHFQWPPSRESKLIRCQRGRVHDVLLDLRPDSSTYLATFSQVLDERRHDALFCPTGVAHGFQTLGDDTEVFYMMSDFYQADLYGGVRFDDAAFGIRWPLAVSAIHERDRSYADFDRASHAARFRAAAAAGASDRAK